MIRQTESVLLALTCQDCLLTTFSQGTQDVIFHSIWTDEGNRDADGHPTTWRAIQPESAPLVEGQP